MMPANATICPIGWPSALIGAYGLMSSIRNPSCAPPWMPECATQPLSLGIDRPELAVAQVRLLRARGRQHRADETELLHDAPQLLDSRVRLLQGQQAHRLEAVAALQVGVVHPVVVRLREHDGPVAADDLPEPEAARGVQDRRVHSDLVQELHPAVRTHVRKCPGRRDVPVRGVQVVDGREGVTLRPRASPKLLPLYSSGMYETISAMSSMIWPSPSMMRSRFAVAIPASWVSLRFVRVRGLYGG